MPNHRLVCLVALLAACGSSPDVGSWEVEGPAFVTTVTRFKGLWTQPGQVGTVPDGALAQADNIVITSDGQIETRRGTSIIASKAMTKLIPYGGRLVGHNRTTGVLSYGDATSATWTDYTGTFPAPTSDQVRAAALNSNLYFTTSGIPYRLDSITGTPEPHGISDALDVQAALSTSPGSALPGNTQTAYRVVFGKRDANGTTILGSPSGRYVVTSPAVTIAIGSLARSGTTVTATLSAGVSNPFLNGETIYLTPGETNFAAGNKTITGVTATTITYTEAGSAVSSTSAQTIQYPTRDASLTYSIPANLPSGAFVQAYRSQPSGAATVDPNDELGLIYEGTGFPTVKTVSQLQRATNVVTATTTTAHGFTAGEIVRVSPGGTLAGHAVAIGSNTTVQRSADHGASWSGAGISGLPAGTYYGATAIGLTDVVVGSSVAATSSDGLTFTSRTIPAGTYRAVTSGAGRLVAVGDSGVSAYSTNSGSTWSAGGTLQWNNIIGPVSVSAKAVLFDGSKFVASAPCDAGVVILTSTDGATWTQATVISATAHGGIAFDGTTYVVAGSSSGVAMIWHATNLSGAWTSVSLVDAGTLNAVTASGSAFVAVGTTGKAYYSGTGASWAGTALAGTWRSLTWDGSAIVAVGDSVAATAPANGQTWTTRTIAAGTYSAALSGGGSTFAPGEYTIASTPLTTTFTYADTGADGTLVQSQTATPLTGAIVDQVPAYFVGAALYTNPGQQGMAGSAAKLWGAKDVAAWRETAFYANITYPSAGDLYLLAVSDGTSGGIRAGDVITIDGLAYTASASTESISNRTFKLSASTSAATRLFETAQSLIRIINRTDANTITAQDTSSSTDPGPRIHLQENNTSTTLTIAFTGDAASWSVANLQAPLQRKNELRWSSLQQPDVVPLLNYKWIGSADKAILRVVPTRTALYVLKEDGIWIVSGYSSPWSIDPFDPTIKLVAPESAAVLDNQIYCLARNGVMRISDNGVTVVSRPIENLINESLTPTMLPVTAAYAFGTSDERDHKYYLWLPSASTDTIATKAYVYDMFTDAWTARTDDMAHGLSNPQDDRLYFVDGISVRQERKDFQPTDLADETYAVTINSGAGTTSLVLADATNALVGDVIAQAYVYGVITAKNGNTVTLDRAAALSNGAATVYRAISTVTRWAPKLGPDPALSYRFHEASLSFRDVYFSAATISYATDWYPTWTDLVLSGSDYGWSTTFPVVVPTEANPTALVLRSLVDDDHKRGTQLYIKWSHAQAWSPMKIQALSTIVTPISQRVGR